MSLLDEWAKRWPNFAPDEVLSPDGTYAIGRGIVMIQPILMDKLQELRDSLMTPVLVNHGDLRLRGYRSLHENLRLVSAGAARQSFHVQGLAVDITVPAYTPDEVAEMLEEQGWHGIGVYRPQNFVHADLRPALTDKRWRWEGFSSVSV